MENAETPTTQLSGTGPTTGAPRPATPAREPVTEGPSRTGQGEAPDHGRYRRLTTKKTTCSYRFAFISIENLPQPGRETRCWAPPHRDTGCTAPSCCPGPGQSPHGRPRGSSPGGAAGARRQLPRESQRQAHGEGWKQCLGAPAGDQGEGTALETAPGARQSGKHRDAWLRHEVVLQRGNMADPLSCTHRPTSGAARAAPALSLAPAVSSSLAGGAVRG